LELRSRLHEIIAQAFQGSKNFAVTFQESFGESLNADHNNFLAKPLARHIDEVMRNEADVRGVEKRMEGVIGIFRFVTGKDSFEHYYKEDLAKRLVQRSSSQEAEIMMINKFKDECGAGFTSKLEGMIRDVNTSEELQNKFSCELDVKATMEKSGIDFSICVITGGLWPTQSLSAELTYPETVTQMYDMYASFYGSQNAGRSLRWCSALGHCVLQATFLRGIRKELVVSHLQALVLLLFNGADALKCEEIRTATGIPVAELHQTLQSLALQKHVTLLLKDTITAEVCDSDVFTFNWDFSHTSVRVTAAEIAAKDLVDEGVAVEQRVFEDRVHEVDAAIVRMMKRRKILAHQELVTDVSSVLRFPATAAEVAKRIEALIDREYLERDAVTSTYNYLA